MALRDILKIKKINMSLLLKNATYIDWQSFDFTEADILIEEGLDGKIKLFYPGEAETKNVEIINCSGKFVTKSLANGHHHVYSALAPYGPTGSFSSMGITSTSGISFARRIPKSFIL